MSGSPVIERSTSPPRHSRVCSSVMTTDRDDLHRSSVGGGVKLEVDRAHPGRGHRLMADRLQHGGGAGPFPAAVLGDAQSFLAPQPLDLLVVHRPPVRAGVPGGVAETPAAGCVPATPATTLEGPRPGPPASSAPLPSMGGPVLTRHPANEPLRDTHRSGQMVHGSPASLLAYMSSKVSSGDLLQCRRLQLCVRQQPLQGPVLPLEVLEPFRVVGLQPAELIAPPRPPIVVGGRSTATLRVVAQHADVWNIPGGAITDMINRSALLDRSCAEIGRDPATITRLIALPVRYDHPGDTQHAIAEALDAGFRHVILMLPAPLSDWSGASPAAHKPGGAPPCPAASPHRRTVGTTG